MLSLRDLGTVWTLYHIIITSSWSPSSQTSPNHDMQEDQSLASREGRWELCGPFINTCKRLLSVLLTAEPRSVIIILTIINKFHYHHQHTQTSLQCLIIIIIFTMFTAVIIIIALSTSSSSLSTSSSSSRSGFAALWLIGRDCSRK